MTNPAKEYELFTQSVCQQLSKYHHFNIKNVQHNIKLKGRSGCKHQIDVYWEYEKDGVNHRVAIECKNYNKRVSKEKVCAFQSILVDLEDVEGIMVSKKGFQSGAKQFAEHNGILLKELRTPNDGETVVGTIELRAHIEKRHTRFKVDEEWAKNNNFDIQRQREFYAMLDYQHAESWRSATHIPLETINNIIVDSKGKKITTLAELSLKISDCNKSDYPFVFKFDDAYIECRHFGLVKILEVTCDFESEDQKMTIDIDAGNFVKAILKDTFSAKTEFVVMR